MKQTAVEWIEGYLKRFNFIEESLVLRKAFEKAKEMEKQQIIDAFNDGYRSGTFKDHKLGSKYYQEYYKK